MWLQEINFKMRSRSSNKNKFKDSIQTCMAWFLVNQPTIFHIVLLLLIISRNWKIIMMQLDISQSYLQNKDANDIEERLEKKQIQRYVTRIIVLSKDPWQWILSLRTFQIRVAKRSEEEIKTATEDQAYPLNLPPHLLCKERLH